MCTYAYVHFVIGFSLLCALGTPWANYSAVFPEKVRQWRNGTCSTSVLYVPHKREIESCLRKTANVRFKLTIFQKKENIDKSELIIVVVVVLTTVENGITWNKILMFITAYSR